MCINISGEGASLAASTILLLVLLKLIDKTMLTSDKLSDAKNNDGFAMKE